LTELVAAEVVPHPALARLKSNNTTDTAISSALM
jgi:hypothetical protein